MLLRLENQFQADEPAPNDLNTNVIIDTKVAWNNNALNYMHYLSLSFGIYMVSLIFGILSYISFYVYVHIKAMFSNIQVEEMTELSLGGNALLSSIKRLQWRTVPSSELLTFPFNTSGPFWPCLDVESATLCVVLADFSHVANIL